MKREQPIYGNCKVLAPDGELMFRCLEKRAKWYLDRNLATIEDEDPLTVRLTFEPKGRGVNEKDMKSFRLNRCVVCGDSRLEVLTRHHIVPYEYRRYLPDEIKSHRSAYIVPICKDDHDIYERDFALAFKEQLAKEYEAPRNNGMSACDHQKKIKRIHIGNMLITLAKYRNKIPKTRIAYLHEMLKIYMEEMGVIVSEQELDDQSSLGNYIDFFKYKEEMIVKKHGQIVIEACKDMEAFNKRWVNHFITSMKPKYMPDFLMN